MFHYTLREPSGGALKVEGQMSVRNEMRRRGGCDRSMVIGRGSFRAVAPHRDSVAEHTFFLTDHHVPLFTRLVRYVLKLLKTALQVSNFLLVASASRTRVPASGVACAYCPSLYVMSYLLITPTITQYSAHCTPLARLRSRSPYPSLRQTPQTPLPKSPRLAATS